MKQGKHFKVGDRVQIARETQHMTSPLSPPVGALGMIARFYREQDGVEMYGVWMDTKVGFVRYFGMPHTALTHAPEDAFNSENLIDGAVSS